MDVKNEISEELRSLSAFVATISREDPYRAPDGYFSELAAMILQRLQAFSPGREAPGLGDLENAKPLTFNVPDGYFEGFAQQVLNRIKAGADAAGTTAGKVLPEPDELPAILASAARINPYRAPEGYFEELSPVLAVVRGKNPYTIPAGYFDHLAAEIGTKTAQPARAAEKQGARVVSMSRRRNWLKYSAAAVVAGLIVTAGWLYSGTTSPASGGHTSQPAIVQPTIADISQNLSKVSDQDLQNFLADQDTTLAQPVQNNASMATLDMSDSDLKTLLGDVPDGELKQYMEEHGGAMDIATN